MRNESRVHQVLPPKDPSLPRTLPDRVKVSVSNTTADTIMVTVNFFNITESDAGTYRVVQLWKLQDLDHSVFLKPVDETCIPKIAIAGHNLLNSTLVLECRSSSLSAAELFWRVNGSLIENQGRYSHNNTFLSIRNLSVDDQYNLYKCKESGSGFESEPYSVKISGPNVIKFEPNITMVQEYSGLNVSCLSDCFPICSWKWTKPDASVGQDNVISTSNTLRIKNITRHDSGMYSCRVLNKITGIELENLTPIQIVYGPEVISFNSSNKFISLDENDSITISCSADCFPPCQIGWTETSADIQINGGELKLVKVNRNCNFTCHVTNAKNGNATISDSIYVIVKSVINHNKTTAMPSEEDAEEFLFKRHLLYVLLGTGITVAVAFLTGLLYKIRTWLCVDRVSNMDAFTDCKKDDGDKNLKEEVPSGNYWTITSSTEGELSSVIETDFERRRQHQLIGQSIASTNSESNEPVRPREVQQVIVEVDGYINPTEAYPVELENYIHPIHSDPVNSDFVPTCQSTEV